MADDIVQTIKVEVEGGDEAADALNKVGESATKSFEETQKAAETAGVSIEDFGKLSEKTQQAYIELSQRVVDGSQQIVSSTQQVEQAAARAGSGTQDLGKGLDQVSQKSGISSRELRSLSKLAKEFGADSVVVGLSLVRMAAILGPVGAALFALAQGFAFIKGKMKETEEATKAITQTFANIAKASAEMQAGNDAAFWGTTAAAMRDAANDASRLADQYRNIAAGAKEVISPLTSAKTEMEAFIIVLQRAGISVNDVMADTKKLGDASEKAALEAAKIYEKLSPIEKLNFEKMLKSLGFTDEQIKNIEKGSEALRKLQERARDPAFKQQQAMLEEFGRALDASQKQMESWGRTLAAKFTEAVLGWKKIIAGGFGFFGDVLAEAGRQIMGGLAAIGSSIAQAVASWVTTQVSGAWQWIVDSFNSAVSSVVAAATQVQAFFNAWVTTPVANAWQWIADTFNSAVGWVLAKAGEVQAFINAWVVTPVGEAWDWLKSTFFTAVDSVLTKGQEAKAWIDAWVVTPVGGAWQWLKSTFFSAVDSMISKAHELRSFIGSLFSGGGGNPAGPAIPRQAGGGLLGGRGTGTSDSNLAWVSRGEHIMPARAVAQPGVLAFLEALRRSGGNLRGILDGMGRFALGGLAAPTLSLPALAGGGAMNHVTIQFPGVPEITGLRASSAVVDELRKAAAMAQVRSGGRKPSRYS
jgi:hypothetical protein